MGSRVVEVVGDRGRMCRRRRGRHGETPGDARSTAWTKHNNICFVIKIGKKASVSTNRNTTEGGTVEEREDRMGGRSKRRQTSDLRPSKANFESAT